MRKINLKAFTLIELMIVVVIIGVMATMIVPQFSTSQERKRDAEALMILEKMQYAEKMYKLKSDNNVYTACTSNSDCESKLGIDISGSDWTFTVDAVTATGFTAKASRANSGRVISMTESETKKNAKCTGTGCLFT